MNIIKRIIAKYHAATEARVKRLDARFAVELYESGMLSKNEAKKFLGIPIPASSGLARELNDLATHCRGVNEHFWRDLLTNEPLANRNRGEMLMLMVTELAEAMEGERKGLMDTHLTHRPMAEVELADCVIRLMDYAGGFGYDIGGAVVEKLAYNAVRKDHKKEARLAPGGKKC